MKNLKYLALAGIFAACGSHEQELENNNAESIPQAKGFKMENKTSMLKNYKGYPIVFYNVENLFDTQNDPRTNDDSFTPEGDKAWDEERYNTKLEKLSEAITSVDDKNPIIIGMVEVENASVMRDLQRTGKLNDTKYRVVHFDSPDKRGIDCGLLYDLERFKVTSSSKIRVEFDWNRDMTTRDILYVKGELMNEKELHVFVNHWSSRREGKEETEIKRTTAAKLLRDKVDEILDDDANANILIMGDFNDHPTDKSVAEVLKAKEATNLEDGDLVNLLYEEHRDGEGTHNYRRDWAVLDQMIVSQGFYKNKNNLGIEKNNAFINRQDFLIFTYPDGGQKPNATYGGPKYYGNYSDHLPIYLFLK